MLCREHVEKILGLREVEHVVVDDIVVDCGYDRQRLLTRVHLQECLLFVQNLEDDEVGTEKAAYYLAQRRVRLV